MRRPKYALAAYDADAEDDEIRALCLDAENLFGDPPPPARGTYELIGCAPEGELNKALTRARADGSASLGILTLEILDKEGVQVEEWSLEDVRVLGDRPCARDLSLRDITIEASESPRNPHDYPQCPPLSPGYRLRGAQDEPWGGCRDLAHVQDGQPDLAEPSVRLLGCSLRGALRAALDAGEEDLGHARLIRLDTSGRTVQSAVEGELVAWIPSARGRGLVDLTLEPWSERPPPAAEEVWELWDGGRPSEPGRWARCGVEARRHWLGVALDRHEPNRRDAEPGGTYHLDGRHVTDHPGFFCALGEAVNGPAGYFGWGLDALTDCLRGRWGAQRPFTLVWHDADVARTCLGLVARTDHRPRTFEELLEFLAEKDVAVRLE
ncbi:barstar family protein [Streptomyces sp. NBC_00878]|uniref:barstar family protein n=1 Tax=Streptomyces sp. NBC_00878 TaxID=2975854 RepID=UPI002254C6AC|nr:barstar family protein [Streptomyces sp. NBC_00878]MCX4908040.1 barstar family protein [Streptomyces sp. NBC_00878]